MAPATTTDTDEVGPILPGHTIDLADLQVRLVYQGGGLQGVARAFGIQFSSETGTQEYAWQTSWGASTRLVGALIMAHGDDAGLRMPPTLAPIQVVVLLIRDEEGTRRAATALVDELRGAGWRVRLDDRVEKGLEAARAGERDARGDAGQRADEKSPEQLDKGVG